MFVFVFVVLSFLVFSGVVVPTPTLLLTASTWNVFVSTVTFEETYAFPVTWRSYVGAAVLTPILPLVIIPVLVFVNWTVFEGLHAFAKLQTVNGSAWIPQVSVPRFVTQDSENWTLAAVELVYRF